MTASMLPRLVAVLSAIMLVACGGGGGGSATPSQPAARAQTISFGVLPVLAVGGSAAISVSTNSGLSAAVRSTTPAVCSVNPMTGAVTAMAIGTCTVAADQAGDAGWAPATQALMSFPVTGKAQAIAFGSPPTLACSGRVTVNASAGSGLPLRFASASPTVCVVEPDTGVVTGLTVGTCLVTADQAGDAVWAAAPMTVQSFPVVTATQTIDFGADPALTVGGSATLVAVAGSGLPLRFSAATPAVCAVGSDSGVVSGLNTGICTIAADQAGNPYWAPAPQATRSFPVLAATQTIAFGPVPKLAAGGTASVAASATSGLSVTYATSTPAVCTVDAGSGAVTGLAAGNCVIAAGQAGNANWRPAAAASLSFAVAGASQTISFGPVPSLSAGSQASISATAGSGLPVAYASTTPAVCTVNAGSAAVVGLAAGNCSISASQAGNAFWAAAPEASRAFQVLPGTQTIAFGAPPTLVAGGSATVTASATSGLAVGFYTATPTVCSVDAASGAVSGLATGSCVIAANQAGNANWLPAAAASQSFAVTGAAQWISFGAIPTLSAGGSASVSAMATSGLPVAYASLTPAVCSVNAGSGQVVGLAFGSCLITANQAGDAFWSAAVQASQRFAVAVNPLQTISFGTPPRLSLAGKATVVATASSNLPVSYASLSPAVCSVNAASGQVTDLGLGDCVIAADQPGNAEYNPAPRATQTIAVEVPAGVTVPGAPAGVTATLGSNVRSVVVNFGAVDGGGNPVTGYTVRSVPAGITVNAKAIPVTVNCPVTCNGLAFTIQATNGVGDGAASSAVHVLTSFDVVTTFREPQTQPRDTLFSGSFTLDSTTGAVTGLAGSLTESMTGTATGGTPYYDMVLINLGKQLATWHDAALGGQFVAAFKNADTATFWTGLGGDGWSPASGIAAGGLFAGWPAKAKNPGNAYALIFVPDNPFQALTSAQVDALAYADCTPTAAGGMAQGGGMMGAVCMTGTSAAAGSVGTMGGFPVSQSLVRR